MLPRSIRLLIFSCRKQPRTKLGNEGSKRRNTGDDNRDVDFGRHPVREGSARVGTSWAAHDEPNAHCGPVADTVKR